MLFRTEEIVDPSTTSLEDNRFRGKDFCYLATLNFHPNPICAVGTGVLDVHCIVWVSAVDQQQKINRSSDFELFAPVYLHMVGEEVDEPRRLSWIFSIYAVAAIGLRKDRSKFLKKRKRTSKRGC